MATESVVPIPRVVGLDIGGANLKASLSTGSARSRSFPLWRAPHQLASELTVLLDGWANPSTLAVTMTGELCDCFRTKSDGVCSILGSVRVAFPDSEVWVWSTDGDFGSLEEAKSTPWKVAAANWHAQATFVSRFAPCGPAILIDTGSTTTDIIPIRDEKPIPQGTTDPARLKTGELVYTGARRTPICALIQDGVAAEWFATVQDAYLVLGKVPEEPWCTDTADGQPVRHENAHARLSRMLGGDPDITSREETMALAHAVHLRQRCLIASGIEKVLSILGENPTTVIFSGSGEWLAEAAWTEVTERRFIPDCATQLVRLSKWASPAESGAACAYALAVLAEERMVE